MFRWSKNLTVLMRSTRVSSERVSVIRGHLLAGGGGAFRGGGGNTRSFLDSLVSCGLHTDMSIETNTTGIPPKLGEETSGPTVGIIVIGDEILKGHVQDVNTHFLCKKLFSLGVKVKRVSVVPDDLNTIANEVSLFSKTYTHVITTGGIGPTHDDVTFEGVAKAFSETVKPHPYMVALCKEFFGTDDLASPKLKLAYVPESAKLNYGIDKRTGKRHKFPIVSVKNVYVFPGVPRLMERGFIMLEDIFRNPNAEFFVREVYINTDESSIAGVLNEVDARFKDKVILGSYPDFYNSYYKVKLTFESDNVQDVEDACRFLKQELPPGLIVDYDKDPIVDAMEKVYAIAESREQNSFTRNVRHALEVIEEALDRYRLSDLCLGFNGGKDCTVLLHLFYAAVRKKHPDSITGLKVLYIRRGQPFPEIELFIKNSTHTYQLDIMNIHRLIKDALKELQTTQPNIKAVLMGTRHTDPYSANLTSFAMTDPDWPQYMRVNPILEWTYSDVWTFIRKLNLPYCALYDRGYTSLGSMENTHPNPTLQRVDEKGIISYLPAYLLADDKSERAGRN